MYTNFYSYKLLFVGLAITLTLTACKKFVQADPPKTAIVTQTVFNNDITATSAILGIYSRMVNLNDGFASGGYAGMTELAGLSSDELLNYSLSDADRIQFNVNALVSTNAYITSYLWAEPYQYIYSANAILEGLQSSSQVSDAVKVQLSGEARFIRAFTYFYLANMFGDLPLILSTDYRSNSHASRVAKSLIYQQVIEDLLEAQKLLKSDYVKTDNSTYPVTSAERIRPNKSAAMALLARVYLYNNDWVNAESLATTVINTSSYYVLPTDLNKVFLKNSMEAIFQLMPVTPSVNTAEGFNFILSGPPDNVSLNPAVVAAFEIGDKRKTSWIGSYTSGPDKYYYPYKYKINSGTSLQEYSMVLRLAEQYLIRAEARTWQSNITGAQEDINTIRKRAGLTNTTASDKNSLLLAIENERQSELFTESADRWFNLVRTGRATVVLAPLKGASWQPTDMLYPVPFSEIQNNPNISQNPGY